MRQINVRIPESYLSFLDDLVKMGIYNSRSEAIRAAIIAWQEDIIQLRIWKNGFKKVYQ